MNDERYGIELIVGKREAGKTTFGIRDMVRKIDAGVYKKGYSNIHVKHPKVKFVKFEQLYKIKEPSINGVPTAVLYLDQLHKYVPSRQSMCARNKYMNDQAVEARQHGLDWIGTTWAKSQIDLQVRKFTPITVRAIRNNFKARFEYTFTIEDPPRMWAKNLSWENAEKWWRYFDTSELVEDVPSDWDPRTGSKPVIEVSA